MCDRCDRSFDRRRFLRHAALAGGAVAFGADALWTTGASAAPLVAAKAVSPPKIVTRAEWGANEALRAPGTSFAPIRKLIIHHTGSGNKPADPAGVVRSIYEDHVTSRGYSDIAYNFLIDHKGVVYEGRWARTYAADEVHDGESTDRLGVTGAHALGVNIGSCGICLIGNFVTGKPTDAAMYALITMLAWKAQRHAIDPVLSEQYLSIFGDVSTFGNIAGHINVGLTICPGNNVISQMNAIRGSVQSMVGRFPANPVNMATAVRYRDGRSPITANTPTGDDVRPGHGTTRSGSSTPTTSPAPAPIPGAGQLVGYRVLASGGSVFTLGKATKVGQPSDKGSKDVVAIAPGAGQSFFSLDRAGNVLAFGGAKATGTLKTAGTSVPATDLTANRSGDGYWILTAMGGVYGFGGAKWYGSLQRSGAGTKGLRMHASPTGKGYWILGQNGRMYAFGDAKFQGSPAQKPMRSLPISFWPTPTGKGYWVVALDGSVWAFGDATYLGDMRSITTRWTKPAVDILGMPNGTGYHILTADGGVFAFGKAPFFGSLAGTGRKAVGIAPAVV